MVLSSQLLNEEEEWRGLRFLSASRWVGNPVRKLVFGVDSRPSGSRPFDGRNLATRSNRARSPLRLCGSAPLRFLLMNLRLSA
jgi:hypothetical protein